MMQCPKCKNPAGRHKKQWYYGPPNDPKRFTVYSFRCKNCRAPFIAWIRGTKITIRMKRAPERAPKEQNEMDEWSNQSRLP